MKQFFAKSPFLSTEPFAVSALMRVSTVLSCIKSIGEVDFRFCSLRGNIDKPKNPRAAAFWKTEFRQKLGDVFLINQFFDRVDGKYSAPLIIPCNDNLHRITTASALYCAELFFCGISNFQKPGNFQLIF